MTSTQIDSQGKQHWIQDLLTGVEGGGGHDIIISKATLRVVVFQACPDSHLCYISSVTSQRQIRVKLDSILFPADSYKPVPLALVSLSRR